MKAIVTILLLSCSTIICNVSAQNLEVDGEATISTMQKQITADSVVVWLNDGTLAIRDVSTLTEFQVLSISNDTIYLTNGGFVKLNDADSTNEKISAFNIMRDSLAITEGSRTIKVPVDSSNTNEIQTISRNGLNIMLSEGGGSFQDSVNVYIAGTGIEITNNVIRATGGSANPWCLGKDTLGGIVFYIYQGLDGQDHGLIVHKQESLAQWQGPTSLTNPNRTWDGVYNMGLMTNSPAKTYVLSLGADWYLPSIDELSILWHNRFHTNKALFDGGFTLLSTNANYWSSTEGNAPIALYFVFYYGNAYFTNKASILSVRAIRAF